MDRCQSWWSGARLSQIPASARNVSVWASRKLEHSTTNTSTSMSSASTSGSSVLPAATARRPLASSMAVAIIVVVVLPSVPVTPTIGRGPPGRSCSQRYASSSSLRTGTPASAAAANSGWCSASPGLGDTSSTAPTSSRSSGGDGASTRSTPRPAAVVRASGVTRSSATVTVQPRCCRARTVASPVMARP